jgi:hypothetical protein
LQISHFLIFFKIIFFFHKIPRAICCFPFEELLDFEVFLYLFDLLGLSWFKKFEFCLIGLGNDTSDGKFRVLVFFAKPSSCVAGPLDLRLSVGFVPLEKPNESKLESDVLISLFAVLSVDKSFDLSTC